MTFTLVAFHAHPDDETLLTGGTLARAAAEGHRVVLVTATLGESGLSAGPTGALLGERRHRELLAAATALGCARVETLGYLDSGLVAPVYGEISHSAGPGGWSADSRPTDTPGDGPADGTRSTDAAGDRPPDGTRSTDAAGDRPPDGMRFADAPGDGPADGTRFADAPVDEAAARLAAILREERADVLTGYDPRGGYGHPDHVQVHRVAAAAARLAGTPVLLEATVDRAALRPALAALRLAGRLLPSLPLGGAATAFTARADITHVVDVRAYGPQKRAAMRAHASQGEGGGVRTLALLSRLPGPLFRAVAGREWFVEVGRAPGPKPCGDIFETVRRARSETDHRSRPASRP
ncbi:PIG-L family deacetylase [Dactylosporangium darangshiense]|uniref:PIG-L family deacetylase n=1 Tax=Dactylosporangium darangshiense TaxID=579108 RepID=A0ABP8DBQ5_9ACTN